MGEVPRRTGRRVWFLAVAGFALGFVLFQPFLDCGFVINGNSHRDCTSIVGEWVEFPGRDWNFAIGLVGGLGGATATVLLRAFRDFSRNVRIAGLAGLILGAVLSTPIYGCTRELFGRSQVTCGDLLGRDIRFVYHWPIPLWGLVGGALTAGAFAILAIAGSRDRAPGRGA